MIKEKLAEIKLPGYSRQEEIINSLSHALGVAFGIYALINCIIISVNLHSTISVVASAVYGLSMIFLYSMSTVYHGLRDSLAKRLFRAIDHCAVFFLISGSYTPMLLCGVREYSPVKAYVVLAIVWTVTVVGSVLNLIDIKKYKGVSMACYILVGWLMVFDLGDLMDFFGKAPVMLILSGGISYTIGALIYNLGKKIKYSHCIFHFFVLAGSVLQYISLVSYIL